MKTIILIMFLAGSLRAQTNLTFDVLSTRQGDFTNATIIRTTAAYAVVSHPGGLAKVALGDLPPTLQEKYGYDPDKAAAQLEAEKRRGDQIRRAKMEQQKQLAALAGPVQNVRVTAIYDALGSCQIQTAKGTVRVCVLGLPCSVNNYYATRASLQNSIARLSVAPIVATATSRAGTGASLRMMEDAHAKAVRQRNEQLKYLREQLADLKKEQWESTTIAAYPTGLNDNGIPRWQAVQ